jgi:hypothetical protein
MSERLRNVKAKLRRTPMAFDVHPRVLWPPLEPLDRKKGHIFKQIRRNVRQVKENFQQLRKDIKNHLIFEVQRASTDVEVKVRRGAGPVEITLMDVEIEESERCLVPYTGRTFVILEGETVVVGSHDKVAVVWAKKFVPTEASGPLLLRQVAEAQTR